MMDAAEIARLREPTGIDSLIAKMTYMTHGHIGIDWRTGKYFAVHDKGNEFEALCESVDALRAARTREASLLDALEQAQKERDKMREELPALWGQYDDAGRKLWISYREQRGLAAELAQRTATEHYAARQDAKDARALLHTVLAWFNNSNRDRESEMFLRARIEAMLEKKL